MGDALHTQRAVSIQIVKAGGYYIWFARGNQPQLAEDIRLWFEPDPAPLPGQGRLRRNFETVQEIRKGHGRLEERTLTVSSLLNDFLGWPYLQQVFKLERRFTSTKTGKIQEQIVYGITSLSRDTIMPTDLLKKICAYWGIENGLHYRRDTTLREDYTRMTKGNAGRVMALLLLSFNFKKALPWCNDDPSHSGYLMILKRHGCTLEKNNVEASLIIRNKPSELC